MINLYSLFEREWFDKSAKSNFKRFVKAHKPIIANVKKTNDPNRIKNATERVQTSIRDVSSQYKKADNLKKKLNTGRLAKF